jgi:D-sedoheptulose 7-phosphate isomerase
MRDHFSELAALAAGAPDAIGPALEAASRIVTEAALSGHTVFTFGNGGSATQAQHLAAELIVRYKGDRIPFPAVALTADSAVLTALTNDYEYGALFERQLEALGRIGDVAVGLSTSGKSPNVLRGLAAARRRGMGTILLTGESGRGEAGSCDAVVVVPSAETAHIQEIHLAAIHFLCREVDRGLRERGVRS